MAYQVPGCPGTVDELTPEQERAYRLHTIAEGVMASLNRFGGVPDILGTLQRNFLCKYAGLTTFACPIARPVEPAHSSPGTRPLKE
jgi:hypothetical protein